MPNRDNARWRQTKAGWELRERSHLLASIRRTEAMIYEWCVGTRIGTARSLYAAMLAARRAMRVGEKLEEQQEGEDQ